MMNYDEISQYLPHRYPFMMIDRVIELEVGNKIVGIKNVTINEPHFTGHFPEAPIMPGVLMLEAMAQLSGILGLETMGEERTPKTSYVLAGSDKVRFKRPVIPGDQLVIEATVLSRRSKLWKFECKATVDGELACRAEILCSEREM
jgi:3-hydroxyacyl-[acyl-carrier-protein] dehydratase